MLATGEGGHVDFAGQSRVGVDGRWGGDRPCDGDGRSRRQYGIAGIDLGAAQRTADAPADNDAAGDSDRGDRGDIEHRRDGHAHTCSGGFSTAASAIRAYLHWALRGAPISLNYAMPIGRFFGCPIRNRSRRNPRRRWRRTLRQTAPHCRSPGRRWFFSPIVRSGKNGPLIGGFGRPRRLNREMSQEPAGPGGVPVR
jgi:hypothetical protein